MSLPPLPDHHRQLHGRNGGSEVEVVGLNDESLNLFERIGGQESAHA